MFELPAKDDAKSNAATPFSQPQPASADALALQPGGAWQGEWKDALEPMEITPSAPRAAADTVATPQSPFGKFSGSAKQHTDSESPAVAAAESDSRASAAMEEPKAVQLFPRAGQLSGNLGIGGSRSMKIPALPTAPATPSTTNGEQPKFRLFGDPAPPDSDQTETTTAETNSGEAMQPSTAYVEPSPWSPIIKKESQPNGIAKSQMTDRTSSPQRFGWPDQGTALPGSGTRTAEPPEGSFADASNTSVFGPSEIHTANPEGAASAGGVMGSGEPATEVPVLQKVWQSVEQQREPQKPDTLLLAMMEKGLRRHSSAAPKATAKSQQSKAQAAAPQAVKTQPTETRGPVRHRVEIILEKHQLLE